MTLQVLRWILRASGLGSLIWAMNRVGVYMTAGEGEVLAWLLMGLIALQMELEWDIKESIRELAKKVYRLEQRGGYEDE